MWDKTKSLLLLLSLTVNGAFIVTFASHALFASSKSKAAMESCCPLRQQLGATDAQWQKIEPRLAAFRGSCRKLCRQISRDRQELIALIAAPEVKGDAIHAKEEAIVAGQRKLQELVVEHLQASRDLLTKEQQKALFDLIRIRCDCDSTATDCDEKRTSSREESDGCCDSETDSSRRS